MTVDRKAFRSLSCGLYVVSAKSDEGRECGCVVNTVLQVASEPPQLLVSINKHCATAGAVSDCRRFCASVLSQEADMELIGDFGFQSSRDIDKFDGVSHEYTAKGLPYLTACTLAVFDVRVDTVIDVGSHLVFIGTVEQAKVLAQGEPLTYSYYHTVLRGKTPPKAASYNEGDDTVNKKEVDTPVEGEKVGWRCMMCGCIVEGYPDGLPEDFVCPICKMPCGSFEKIAL